MQICSMEYLGSILLPLTLLAAWFMVLSSCAWDFPIGKPGCEDQTQCGDVSIPYPFGTRKGCYRDPYFYIHCNTSNHVQKPYLRNSTIPVADIWLEGQLSVMYRVAYDCYFPQNHTRSKRNSPSMLLGPGKVFNSTANKFTVIGCDTYSYFRGESNGRPYTTGCISICGQKRDVVDGSCSGSGCCQISMPDGAKGINVTVNSFRNHTNVSDFNPCSYSFVVANDAFQFYADNLTSLARVERVPAIVDWVIQNKTCEEAKQNASTYACGRNSNCYVVEEGAKGYRCSCSEGYEGNPYLLNGCQDINECKDPDRYPFPKNSTCINTPGNYTWECNHGYHDNGEGGCIADPKPNKRNNRPIIAVVAGSTGMMFVLAFSFCLYFDSTRRKEQRMREEFFKKNGGLILQQKLAGQGGGSYSSKIFTEEELKKATNDFDESQIIGRGGYGTVFRGELMDKRVVAIKKSREVDEHQNEQFINEVILLSQINSRNVVKLLGCCLETKVPHLVYEFVSNGTLFEHLHNNIKASKLSWKIRLRIASEVAGVLSYLHSVASPPIIHRDIKSANILLDQNYTAKVSDFGTSRLVPSDDDQVATMVQGTVGYLDPEYMQTGVLTEKSDVYSFGIVLIELLTGKKVLTCDKPEAQKFLSNGFLSSLKDNHLDQVLDSSILCDENIEQIKEVALIAKRCISVRGEDRPRMKDVERELGALRKEAKQISVEVFEIDSSKSEALVGMLSNIGYGSYDEATSSGQYSVAFTTTEQPLLPISSGR